MDITIRHAEPDDYEAIHRILSGPQAIEGTLQLPLHSVEKRRRWLSEISEGDTVLVACVDDEVVGNLDLIAVFIRIDPEANSQRGRTNLPHLQV